MPLSIADNVQVSILEDAGTYLQKCDDARRCGSMGEGEIFQPEKYIHNIPPE